MSRAFVKEAEDDESVNLPDRPVSAHPNLVTPEGLASIERTIDRFTAAYKPPLASTIRRPLPPRSASFGTGPRDWQRQSLSSHQRIALASILERRSLCDVGMDACRNFGSSERMRRIRPEARYRTYRLSLVQF
jgi:hypothetical protein